MAGEGGGGGGGGGGGMDEGFNSWLYVSTKSGYHKNAALRHTRLHHCDIPGCTI